MSEEEKVKTQQPKADYLMDDESENVNPTPQTESSDYLAAGKLKGKKTLITGGDSGIGQAAALAFAKEGADVAIVYFESDEDAQFTKNRIQEIGQKALVYKGDVGDEAFAQEVIDKLIAEWGTLDVLVNNAGEQHYQEKIGDITAEQLDRTFRTNIFGMFYLTKAAMPHLPKGASIINTSSITAYRGSSTLLDYSATKGAIVSFTRSFSQNKEVTDKKIRVNSVAPGPIWTPLIPATFPEKKLESWGKDGALERPGQPYELAPAYVYLASSDSSYVTGQTIHVNGGVVVNG
ncbi:MAG: SDR family oxidoreductase [Carnobacterium sp.]|uniref:SDR family oxidoreductase n=1 Tax=Carnobacterium antarcticum TaxID=2126436 RepID=A0ABW4NQY2_9LACT|nr:MULTISPECIES: SDR family oxidoreductase [unclassified Carnobacterium]ALV21378.1 oxidoreductase, short chain dehydrogenase/reductase [Carnobacterium sp. CP1]QQP69391.1 SDR family oxidoreductase [Carnobacterium sp. CS13]